MRMSAMNMMSTNMSMIESTDGVVDFESLLEFIGGDDDGHNDDGAGDDVMFS